ncbi:MAG: hypothetical protein PVG71_07020 [Anaerolineae bacterium]
MSEAIRLLHSRVATEINGRHDQRGRRVWYCFSDRLIRSDRHHWATVNYIHDNPVKHGYVDCMTAWPWSSIHNYVEEHGRDHLVKKRAGTGRHLSAFEGQKRTLLRSAA